MAWTLVFGPDPFTAADGTLLSTYNPLYVSDYSNADIVNNRAHSATFGRTHLSTTLADDQAVEGKIYEDSDFYGLLARYTSTGGGQDDADYYAAFWNTGVIYLYLRQSGSFTFINSASVAFSAGDTLRLEVVGTALEAFVNGVSKVTGSNGAIASGNAAIRFGPLGTGYLDDFAVYEQSAAGGQPTMRRWGGVPFMGGQGIGQKDGGGGRAWGRRRSGIVVPARFREAA